MNEIEYQNKLAIYASLRINFTMWNNVGGVYGYKKLVRLPRKQKKALKKSIFRDVIAKYRDYIKECPKPKKMPAFSYKQPDAKCRAKIENCEGDVYTNSEQ